MRKIYIILTHTGTTLSKIIKAYTRAEFSHVSIAIDHSLEEMYSFGRLRPYNPFVAGFVCEHIDSGTFKRFRKTRAKVYSLKVTDDQHEKIKNIIYKMKGQKDIYKFNILGLFAVAFHVKIQRKNSFYCAEFVKYIIERANINNNLPKLVKPESFQLIEGLHEEYHGLLTNYHLQAIVRQTIINN